MSTSTKLSASTSKSFSINQKGLTPLVIVILIAAALVGGYLVFTSYSNLSRVKSIDNQTKITQPQPSPSPTSITHESTTSTETANWKTYTNKDFNFSVKYPSNWYQTESKRPQSVKVESVSFSPISFNQKGVIIPFVSIGMVELNGTAKDIPVKEWILDRVQHLGKPYTDHFTYTDVTISGVTGIRTNDLPSRASEEEVFIRKDGVEYTFSITDDHDYNPNKRAFSIDTYNKILSTFKFLDQNQK